MAKILFIQREGRELNGIMAIASYISDKHESKVIIDNNGSLENKIRNYGPQVVGIPLMTKDHYWGLDLTKKVKNINSSIITLLGGPHPTFYNKLIYEEGVDAIGIGECEKAIKSLLNHIDNQEPYYDIPSLWIKEKRSSHELIIHKNRLSSVLKNEEIPLPNRDIYKNVEGVDITSDLLVMTARGCPFNCNFCINYGLKKLYKKNEQKLPLRAREPESVIEEIKKGQKFKEVKSISFEDDIFGIDKKWFGEFKEMYSKEIGLPFYALLRFDVLTNEFVRELKDMGCHGVAVGIETGNERIRNEILNKKLSNEKIFIGVDVLKTGGMPFNTYVMFGVPEETLENAYETLDINLKIKADVAYTQLFQPYPGTKFFTEEAEKAVISRDFNRFKINHPYDKDWKKIQKLQKLSMAVVSNPSMREAVPNLIETFSDKVLDDIARECWKNIYDKQKREGFK